MRKTNSVFITFLLAMAFYSNTFALHSETPQEITLQDMETQDVIQVAAEPLIGGCEVVKTHENSPIPTAQTLKAIKDIEVKEGMLRIIIPAGTIFRCLPKAG